MRTKEMKIVAPEGYEVDKERSTFEKIVFKEIERYSKTWEEFCERNDVNTNEYYIDSESGVRDSSKNGAAHFPYKRNANFDKNFIPQKFAEPMLALMQLLTIREKEYTRGWEPDWGCRSVKYVIVSAGNKIIIDEYCIASRPLTFPNREMAEEFLKNWKDLIKVAKSLL